MTLRIPGTIWSKDDVSPTFDRQVNLGIVYQAFADYHPKYVKIMGLRFYFILWLYGTAKNYIYKLNQGSVSNLCSQPNKITLTI